MAASQKKKSVQTRLATVTVGEANVSPSKANNASADATRQEERPKMDISVLFAEMTKMGTVLNGVASDVSFIKSDMAELKSTLSATQVRIAEAEARISDVEDKVANVVRDNSKYAEKLQQLITRVDDQENRSRRKNVRLVGLKESLGTSGNLTDCVKKILADGLGLNGEEFEIERCHRSLKPRPNPGQAPRIVFVRFLRYSARHKVLMAAKQKKGIMWENCHLSFYEDMTAERAALRKLFSPVMKTLWQHQVRHTLAHPATLRFTWRDQRQSFEDAKEAEKFVRDNIEKEVE